LLPLLLYGFGVRLCPLLLGVGIVLEALAVGIGGLPLFRYIEGLSFFNENFFANLCMLHHGLLVELTAAVVARDQTASIAILVRLLVLLVVEVGVLMQDGLRGDWRRRRVLGLLSLLGRLASTGRLVGLVGDLFRR